MHSLHTINTFTFFARMRPKLRQKLEPRSPTKNNMIY